MYLSRQRTGPSILDQHYTECKHCASLGFHRSILSLANAILFSIENGSVGTTGITIVAQTSPDVACYILNEKRSHVENIERKYSNTVIISPNDHYIDSKYTIKRLNEAPQGASYQQKEEVEPSMKWHSSNQQSNPLVPQNLYREHPKQSPSAIQRFMSIILPSKDEDPKVYAPRQSQGNQREDGDQKRPQRRRSRSANQTRRQSTNKYNGQRRTNNGPDNRQGGSDNRNRPDNRQGSDNKQSSSENQQGPDHRQTSSSAQPDHRQTGSSRPGRPRTNNRQHGNGPRNNRTTNSNPNQVNHTQKSADRLED
jgi:ribonuclease E